MAEGSFASADSPVTIGVMAPRCWPRSSRRSSRPQRSTAGRWRVRRLRPGDPIAGAARPFRRPGRRRAVLAEILAAARGQALLTVTESDDGLELGSMINFVVVEDKVRFDIAPPPSESSNLKISARLLGVARKVVSKSS